MNYMVKRVLKVLVVLLILGIAGIQFFRPEFKNPVVKKGERLEDLYEVPSDVATILKRPAATAILMKPSTRGIPKSLRCLGEWRII